MGVIGVIGILKLARAERTPTNHE